MRKTITATLLILLTTLVSCGTSCNAGKKGKSQNYTVNGVSFKMVAVEGGTFTMGSAEGAAGAEKDEFPAHKVTVDDFYIAETEVTQVTAIIMAGADVVAYLIAEGMADSANVQE